MKKNQLEMHCIPEWFIEGKVDSTISLSFLSRTRFARERQAANDEMFMVWMAREAISSMGEDGE